MEWKILAALAVMGCSSASETPASHVPDSGSERTHTEAGVKGSGGAASLDAHVPGSAGAIPEAERDAAGGSGFCTPSTAAILEDRDDQGNVTDTAYRSDVLASCGACNQNVKRCVGSCPSECEVWAPDWTNKVCCCPTEAICQQPEAGADSALEAGSGTVADSAAEASPGCEQRALYYRDADEDGHGDPDVAVEACSQPDGYVATSDDCYDGNEWASPTAWGWPAEMFLVHRGDGSFDYDCDGEESKLRGPIAICDGDVGEVPETIPECGEEGLWTTTSPPCNGRPPDECPRPGWGDCYGGRAGPPSVQTVTQGCY